ncbi:hypothetical protein FFI97_001685 [Variovorax sp. KBS0712]|uniref:hypothetical protein n=1 Tax=Variovorax sp. KBS0712 TaxID=2578111 RepID=UPI0011190F53|nr:hypothetical protein [Variovorax sp. KBS0712]TSD59069.1 hypothetical protein FFI97_001685 [Variovorax sp. KBS0712]
MSPLQVLALWSGVAFAIVTANSWVSLVGWADKNPNMASWVQAVGAIVAIAGAFLISDRQHRAAVRAQRENTAHNAIERLSIVKTLLARAIAMVNLLQREYEDGRLHEVTAAELENLADCKEALDKLPVLEIPSARVVLYLSSVPRGLSELHLAWTAASAFTRLHAPELKVRAYEKLTAKLPEVLELIRLAGTACEEEMGRLRREAGL